jgi:hypothetical protein
MGKMALLVVMSLSLVVGIITYTINKSKNTLVENVTGFQKYTSARNIAHTGVNMMLSKMDANDTSVTNYLQPNMQAMKIFNISSGICTVYARLASVDTSKRDTVDLIARSRFMDTTRYMKIRLRRQPVPFPTVGEAVGLRIPDANFTMSGTPSIDGRNHTIGGALTAQPDTSNKPGVGVLNPADTTQVLLYGSKIDGTKDVVVDSNMSNPISYVEEYINAADVSYTTGTYGSNMTWGSVSEPWIVSVEGDVKFSGNIEGWGILIVHGDITLTGTFTFHGLVVAYKEMQIDVTFAKGTPDVIGGLLMAGPAGSTFDMRGSSAISYSKDAIELAKYINKLQWYKVVYWYE